MWTLILPTAKWIHAFLLTLAAACCGCCCCSSVPCWQYRQCQAQTMQVYRQQRVVSAELHETRRMAGQLAAEKQQLEVANSQLQGNLEQLQGNLAIANQRLDNLGLERSKLHEKYKSLLTGLQAPQNPLPGSANDRFRELADKYPEFEFDPVTGVSKFTGDLLFASGSDALRPESHRLLHEFSGIMNDPQAKQFKILVVGHTDDQPISKESTRQRHASNWDLSAHRATAVVKQLSKCGLREQRMGVAGYSMFQPVQPNLDESTRQQNRRVEIFVLAPDAFVASGDQLWK